MQCAYVMEDVVSLFFWQIRYSYFGKIFYLFLFTQLVSMGLGTTVSTSFNTC